MIRAKLIAAVAICWIRRRRKRLTVTKTTSKKMSVGQIFSIFSPLFFFCPFSLMGKEGPDN